MATLFYRDCTGIAVIKNRQILLGLRKDGQGWGLAGGKKEADESMEECAYRELKEEFSVTALSLKYIGTVRAEAMVKGSLVNVEPSIYVCENYLGEVMVNRGELLEYKWVGFNEILNIDQLFPPSREGIKLVLQCYNL